MSGENRGDPDPAALSGRLVRVLATPSVTEGLLARGILESEGIPVLTKGEGEGPYRMGPVQLWVPEELEFQARLLLEGPAEGDATFDDSEDTTEDRDRP
jgi:Putative prokaryotic signal transducing protein